MSGISQGPQWHKSYILKAGMLCSFAVVDKLESQMVCFFEKAFRLRDTSLTSLTLKSHCRNDTPIVPAHRKTEINWLAGWLLQVQEHSELSFTLVASVQRQKANQRGYPFRQYRYVVVINV